jgi:hypothetical protein
MFKKGDIVEYNDGIYLNKVKILSDVKYGTWKSFRASGGPDWHCTLAKHIEGKYAGQSVNLFLLNDCRLSLPFKMGNLIKKHTL